MKIRWVLVLSLFLLSLEDNFGFGTFVGDARVHIVSPIEGQQYAPGDKVYIVVDVAPSLYATDGSIGIAGLGSVKGKGFSGKRFTADFLIPEYYAGPLVLWPDVWAGEPVVGPKVRIKVRPLTSPKQLRVLNRYYYLSLPRNCSEHLSVKGRYAKNIERDLSSSDSGTTYMSNNASVVSVDREGMCRVITNGFAVISIENGGVRDFVMFVVDDPAHPSPPIDLSDHVAIRRGDLRLESSPHVVRSHYQQLAITNTTTLPIAGPLFLTVTGLPKGVITYGGNGGGQYRLDLPDEGLGLLPGQSVTVDLEFLNQGNASIEYSARVYLGVMN
jgi:hypothetical protein